MWSTGKVKPGRRGMTIQHFHGVLSLLARIMRVNKASPIPFSILVSFMTVLAGIEAMVELLR